MDLILSQEVHGKVVDGKAQILQSAVGTVGGGDDLLGLLGRELLVQLGAEGVQLGARRVGGVLEALRVRGDAVPVRLRRAELDAPVDAASRGQLQLPHARRVCVQEALPLQRARRARG